MSCRCEAAELSLFAPRCQLGPYCRDNPCKNSGKCIDSLDGPVCECETGFQGDRYVVPEFPWSLRRAG